MADTTTTKFTRDDSAVLLVDHQDGTMTNAEAVTATGRKNLIVTGVHDDTYVPATWPSPAGRKPAPIVAELIPQ